MQPFCGILGNTVSFTLFLALAVVSMFEVACKFEIASACHIYI